MKIRLLALALAPITMVACFPDVVTEVETAPPEPTLAATPTADQQGNNSVDLEGTWGYKTVLTQYVENAFDSTVYDLQTVTSYYVLEHTQGSSETEVIQEAEICLTDLSEVSGSLAILDEGFYVATGVTTQTATLSDTGVGATYVVPESISLRGVNLSSDTGVMPTADDPDTDCDRVEDGYMSSEGVYDYDNNGSQGFTTYVDGAVNANLWTIERLTIGLTGTVFSADSIQGGIDGLLEDVFICSTKPGLVSTAVDIYPEEGYTANFFVMTRMEDGSTCSDVLSQKDSLF